MADHRCLNCESTIPAAARFCPHCSQRTDTARLSFADMTRDLLHAFVNVERGPLVFAWALLTRPGAIAREYVEGRRRRYYGPFATLAVLVGLAALVVNLSGFQVLSQEVSAGPAALLARHFNLLLLVQLPLLGAVCAVLFRDAHLTLPEHMVLVAYTLGVRAVALSVIIPIAVLNSTSTPSLWQNSGFWAAWSRWDQPNSRTVSDLATTADALKSGSPSDSGKVTRPMLVSSRTHARRENLQPTGERGAIWQRPRPRNLHSRMHGWRRPYRPLRVQQLPSVAPRPVRNSTSIQVAGCPDTIEITRLGQYPELAHRQDAGAAGPDNCTSVDARHRRPFILGGWP